MMEKKGADLAWVDFALWVVADGIEGPTSSAFWFET